MIYTNFCAKGLCHGARLALLLLVAANFHTGVTAAQTTQDSSKLSVDDGRPVAKAVEELVARYDYVITYEDPRFAYEEDLQDVTTQVRRDLDQYPPGKAPKVIVPRGGKLTVTIPSSASVNTQAIASVLDQLTRAQAIRREGGRFRVVQVGDVFHVVPTEVRDRNGKWIAQTSILEAPISLPMEGRSADGMINSICKAVSAATHVQVGLGSRVGGIYDPSNPQPYRLGADNERARDVLVRALGLLNASQALTWVLFYAPSNLSGYPYLLTIRSVPNRSSSPIASEVPKTSPGSSLRGKSSPPKK
jgi:hypothetical protein